MIKQAHSPTSNRKFFDKSTSVVFQGEPLNLTGNVDLCSDVLIRPILAHRTPARLMIYFDNCSFLLPSFEPITPDVAVRHDGDMSVTMVHHSELFMNMNKI